MADAADDTQCVVDHILSIFKALLTSSTLESIRSISEELRATNPPPPVLASTINIFAKLLSHAPPTAKATTSARQSYFSKLVAHLSTTPLLSKEVLYNALDGDTAASLVPGGKWRSDNLKIRTRMWYTQTRFNLFREESEGYAKIILLLWQCTMSTCEPSKVFEHILSLIGQFSLDTNRVIEVVLSAAAEKVLESITKTGDLPVVHRIPQPFAHILDQFPQDHVYAVIGAMLRAYQDHVSPDNEAIDDVQSNETDTKASTSLVSLASVMISEGRMKVSDVLGYLSPMENSEFVTRFQQYEKDVGDLAETVNGSRMGAKSTDDDLKRPRPKHGASDRDVISQYKLMERGPLHSFSSQKIHFIVTLIGLCRSKDALTAILGLSVNGEHVDVAAHPTITKPLVGIAEALLNPLLHSKFPSLYAKNTHVLEAIRKLGETGKGYDVPVETIEDLLSDDDDGPGAIVRQILMVLGPNARASIRLLQALCRIFKGRAHKHVVSIMKEVVLPAASLVQSNVALSDAIWDVVKDWPHPLRWDLYGHLDKAVSTTCIAYRAVSSRASYETRYILKRLTADNQKQHTLTIAKITHGQAFAAFSATLDRIQGYPADVVTVSPVVEACRKCTELSIDILLYLVLNRMADSKRSRLKEDGINTAQWYATLSLFLGLCLRKLTVAQQHIDAVLHFLHTKLLEEDEPLLIIALSDIIKCVADMEVDINLSAKQIASHGGGPVLLDIVSGAWSKVQPDAQLCGTVSDSRMERERNAAISALLTAFERTGVHSYVAVAIARLTRDAVYHETIRTMPLKLGANIVDMARTSLLQLSQFMDIRLSDSDRDKEFRERIWKPLRNVGMGKMVEAMGVPVPSAIALMASELDCVTELQFGYLELSKRESLSKESTGNANVLSENGVSRNADSADGPQGAESHQAKAERITDSSTEERILMETPSSSHLAEIIHRRVRGTISKSLLTMFWFAKLSDIAVPVDIYETEQKRFASIQTVWEKEKEAYRPRSLEDTDRFRRLDLELRRIREYVQKLEAERKLVTTRLSSVMKVLTEKGVHFHAGGDKSSKSERMEATYFFLQECVFPRCKLSRPDALFCSKFVQLLLKLDFPAICFAEYYEVLVQLAPIVIRSCSENESLCFSFLIKETLVTLERWRSNRSTYENEASIGKKHGFRDVTLPAEAEPMKHWQFCQWLFGIHEGLANGISAVLSTDEYLYARNSLSLLNAVAEVFPKVSEHCSRIETCVQTLTKSDLADIRLTSTGVLAKLRAGRARRLPKHVFTLKPVGGGGASQAIKNTVKNTSNPPSQQQALTKSDSPARPTAKGQLNDNKTKGSDGKQTSPARQAPGPDSERKGTPPVLPSSGASSKVPSSRKQERRRQPVPVVATGSNGDIARSAGLGTSKPEAQRPLNPDATEFIPSVKREGTNTNSGKRSRSFDGNPQPGASHKDQGGLTNDKRSNLGSDMGPPLKKVRGEDKTKADDREEKRSSVDGSKKNASGGFSTVPDMSSSKPETHKLEREKLVASGLDSSAIGDGTRSGDKQRDVSEVVSRKQPESLDMKEKGGKIGGPADKREEKPSALPAVSVRESGAGRSPSHGRSSSPGRNDPGFRQSFQNGKEYGHGKSIAGERYRDGTGSRNARRDLLSGGGGQGRDTVRDNSGRDHGGMRRREAGGYNYGGGGDRWGSTPGGDFRRSASESRLAEGPGTGDYVRGREYADGHGTKRRRDGGPMRGPYGYESDGRRPQRPRNDGDYNRMRDEGKAGPDRRFNGNSPSRDPGGIAHNPSWMESRWHSDGHEGIRRQAEENHVGWQKRGERELDGGGRVARRDDREAYYERQERYGEGGPRRDDRRRVPRGRPVRRRMGR